MQKASGVRAEKLEECRYDGSKLLLRGPRRDLDGTFVACLGGTETHARYIARPYPDLLEETLGVTCVNFGWPNAGIDVFRSDPALIDCASRSKLCVLQVPNAINMTNMYYRVHPRRNDRVLEATDALRALFPTVEFTQFNFTRHMLIRLHHVNAEKFGYIARELNSLWVAGMRDLLDRIDAPVILLWMSMRSPAMFADRPELEADPALVSRDMLEAVALHATQVVEVKLDPAARGIAIDDAPVHPSTAEATFSEAAHVDTARILLPFVSARLEM